MNLVELKNLTFENELSRNRDSNVKFAPRARQTESGRHLSGKFDAPAKR
jgi:hypothetical protein